MGSHGECSYLQKVVVVVCLKPNIEMNWNLLKFLPELAACQTNFNVRSAPVVSFVLRNSLLTCSDFAYLAV